MSTYFASDLHLDPTHPEVLAGFLTFLEAIAADADALYLLGDLFEMWIGDDDDDAFASTCCNALAVSATRHPVYVMHGNRDFLIAEGFVARTQATLLPDPSPIELYGRTVLLSHGDALCIDDAPYMQARALLRSAAWQEDIRKQSLHDRRALGTALRARSRAENANKSAAIMDVNDGAVATLCAEHHASLLVHGHTHRPGTHARADGGLRIVLGAWEDHGQILRVRSTGEFALLRSNLL